MRGKPSRNVTLRVVALALNGYRRFDRLIFSPAGLNVIVGINGSGKSAMLQALALVLSRLTSRTVSGRPGGLQLSTNDIRLGRMAGALSMQVADAGLYYGQTVAKSRAGRRTVGTTFDFDPEDFDSSSSIRSLPFANLAELYRERLTQNNVASLPVIALYPVNRVVLDIPVRIKGRHTFDQVAAYDGAFETQRNFRTFFEWFREREDLENEERLDRPRHRDPQLQAVRYAIEELMEGYRDLRVRRNPLRMTLKKGDEELLVNQLSDGEKALLSLIGDLARRMAIANPGLKNPLEGEGVVMIDEIDLHLHPSWQRRVVQKLPGVFPNVQFFLTTHSPVVASAVRPESPMGPCATGRSGMRRPTARMSGLVLSEVFDTPPRLEEIRRELDELFVAVYRKDLDDAGRKLNELSEKIGPSDPELIQARVMLQGYASV